MRGAFMPPSPA